MLIRFVGGPWHNRIHDCPLIPTASVGDQLYHLAEFQTKAGTHYSQYIHSSLVNGQAVHRKCYRERFKKWKVDIKRLQEMQ